METQKHRRWLSTPLKKSVTQSFTEKERVPQRNLITSSLLCGPLCRDICPGEKVISPCGDALWASGCAMLLFPPNSQLTIRREAATLWKFEIPPVLHHPGAPHAPLSRSLFSILHSLSLTLFTLPLLSQSFSVSIAPALHSEAFDGRLLVMLSTDSTAEPRFQISEGLKTQLVFGVDILGWDRGQLRSVEGEGRIENGKALDGSRGRPMAPPMAILSASSRRFQPAGTASRRCCTSTRRSRAPTDIR